MFFTNFLNKIRRINEKKVVVLMYHRITDESIDPWQLAVNPYFFEQHLEVLQKRFKVIRVNELIHQLTTKLITANSVCITFDDGYRDNFLNAKPLLEKYKCPASFFIPTLYIGQEQMFWWDELLHI